MIILIAALYLLVGYCLLLIGAANQFIDLNGRPNRSALVVALVVTMGWSVILAYFFLVGILVVPGRMLQPK